MSVLAWVTGETELGTGVGTVEEFALGTPQPETWPPPPPSPVPAVSSHV